MPIIQDIDKKRFIKTHPIYKGSGLVTNSILPYQTKSSKYTYLPKEGGFIDLSGLLNVGKEVVNFVQNNKDLISSSANAVGNIAGAAKSISDTVKTSKELENLKTVQALNQKNKAKKSLEISPMTPEQIEKLKKLGNGFVKF